MTYQHDRELHLTYDLSRGYWHFVLYIEPPVGAGSHLNASKILEGSESRYASEWLSRMMPCDADALHVALVGSEDARNLWHPCVYDDPMSPAAIAGDGCLCWATSRDPLTWLPVAAHHYRTVTGNIENWRYHTFTPLSLPQDERLQALIIDSEAHAFWARTERGHLHLLPERQGHGYGSGYSGGGPTELAEMILKIAESDGHDVSPVTSDYSIPSTLRSWLTSEEADHTQELTLHHLKQLCRR